MTRALYAPFFSFTMYLSGMYGSVIPIGLLLCFFLKSLYDHLQLSEQNFLLE